MYKNSEGEDCYDLQVTEGNKTKLLVLNLKTYYSYLVDLRLRKIWCQD